MLFSSILFLFFFLPLVIAGYFIIGKEYRNYFLLLASLIFYAWDETTFVLIMLVSVLFNYLFALAIEKIRDTSIKRGKEVIIALAIIFNIGLLGFYKYANFITDNLNIFLQSINMHPIALKTIHLPIGISFFTFQAMSYVIDVYRKEVTAQKNPLNVALYISLFPQLVAGPIVRYHDVTKQIIHRHVDSEKFASGIKRFIEGLGKKVLIANTVGLAADKIFAIPSEHLTISLSWLGIICYTLQIYFDFSGYSDMAIGLGRMFGFEFLENFNYPYISRSVREFWKRWHISLTSWFRDYLYIPLGGNRHGSLRTYTNLIIVFFITGLWHGASWTFIIWGLWHGFFLMIERTKIGKILESLWIPLQYLYTMGIVMIGWVLFRADSLSYTISFIKAMFGLGTGYGIEYNTSLYWNYGLLVAIIFGIIFSTDIIYKIGQIFNIYTSNINNKIIKSPINVYLSSYLSIIIHIFILIISSFSLASGTHNPFIYFRF